MSVADLDWCGVRVVVFDVDGTLYSQRRLRRRMEGALAAHCALRPWNLSVLRVIAAFRRAREELTALDVQGVSTKQYTVPARRLGVAPSTVQAVVETWMHERPLRYMSQVRFPDVQQVFSDLKSSGRILAVLSDYPAQRKLDALGLEADLVISTSDACVDRLKPNPAGLRRILELTSARPDECLCIGDRNEVDGECARRLGVRYLLKVDPPASGPHRFARYKELLAGL